MACRVSPLAPVCYQYLFRVPIPVTALDITQLSGLRTLYCGNQNDGRILTLTLTAAQKAKWDSTWSYDPDNVRVTLDLK